MSANPLTPARRDLLTAYCAAIKRAEKRIIVAGRIARAFRYDEANPYMKSKSVQAMAKRMRGEDWSLYATSLMRLRIARSRFAAELEGKPY